MDRKAPILWRASGPLAKVRAWARVNATSARRVVAMVGNPTSDKGRGAKVDAQVLGLLEEAGRGHNFDVIDTSGTSFDDSRIRRVNARTSISTIS